jgi:hypothetical protein
MTGRQLLRRPGYDVDVEQILQACAKHGVAVEINANPWRLDLDWRWHQRALDLGCMMSVNPDAHSTSEIDLTHWGVEMARKGGVPKERVLNCLDLRQLLAHLPEALGHASAPACCMKPNESMPYLVQILLPLYDNDGKRFTTSDYNEVRARLTDAFGGVTAYTRAPAEGLWNSGGTLKRDDIVVVEVMAQSLDRAFWADYRRELEELFHQDEIIIRAQTYEAL